jgi:hypothetical protein
METGGAGATPCGFGTSADGRHAAVIAALLRDANANTAQDEPAPQ